MEAQQSFSASDYLPMSSLTGEHEEEDVSDRRLSSEQSKGPYREQDIYLPIANVARIMKTAVPSNGKIAKDAKECVQECVSEFISFITSEASERCAQEKRKTINGEDVLFAMASLGFDPYIEPLKIYLQKYRDILKADKVGGGIFHEAQEGGPVEPDLVDHFAGNDYELLVTSDGSVPNQTYSSQPSNLEQSLSFS
ncbi:uncharacterized protein LOC143445859 isoform X2 [Clavelina lepadiformis]|uniref:uncharacterized protein LOC143445859 isoform X2 n=1 Tax=Clavelina lepadiformis TaxID=159417 RepID=UPI004041880D